MLEERLDERTRANILCWIGIRERDKKSQKTTPRRLRNNSNTREKEEQVEECEMVVDYYSFAFDVIFSDYYLKKKS